MPKFDLTPVRDGYQMQLQVPDISMEAVSVEDKLSDGTPVRETFTKIGISGFSACGELGEPEALSSCFQLALEDESPDIKISNVVVERIVLKNRVYPVQPPEAYCDHRIEKKRNHFYYNKAAYGAPAKHTPSVYVSETYRYRGQKAASITIIPVTYDPSSNTVIKVKSMTVHLIMNTPMLVRSMGSGEFDRIARVMFKNFQDAGRAIPSEPWAEREKLLIIASSTYYENADLKRFVDFRKSSYDVELVQSSSVGSTKDAYKTFIRNKMPAYCILVGKYQDFPAHTYNSIPSYVYYVASATTKPKPDIALGLFFVRNTESLKNIVDKSISTSQNIDKYPKHHIAFGGNTQQMGNLAPNHCDVIVRQLYDNYIAHQGGWKITECYQVNQPRGGKEKAIPALNEGVRFINYNGHGLSNGWTYGNGSWTTSSSENSTITNTVYPFILSFCCLSGDYTASSSSGCWAEYVTGHKSFGSAILASTTTSYTSMHATNRGVLRAIFEKKITRFGPAFVSAENYTYDSASSGAETAVWQYHCFGDPTLETIGSDPSPVEKTVTKAALLYDLKFYGNAITYTVPGHYAENIQLQVYTVKGRLIRTLVKGNAIPGTYTIDLEKHASLCPGVYYCRMDTKGFNKTIPLIIQ